MDSKRRSDMLDAMLRLQAQANSAQDPSWLTAEHNFARGVLIKTAALLERYGQWRWWCKGTPDIQSCQSDLVDIWQFGLSAHILAWHRRRRAEEASPDFVCYLDGDPALLSLDDELTKGMLAGRAALGGGKPVTEAVHDTIDNLVMAAAEGQFDIEQFGRLLVALDMDVPTLAKKFFGREALKRFRQAYGFKEGAYESHWFGEPDKAHLEYVLSNLPPETFGPDPQTLLAAVQRALGEIYAGVVLADGARKLMVEGDPFVGRLVPMGELADLHEPDTLLVQDVLGRVAWVSGEEWRSAPAVSREELATYRMLAHEALQARFA